MDPLNPPAIYGEVVAGKKVASDALRKHIRILASDLKKNTFDLAEAFMQAQETGCYSEWGFDSLGEYASIELGIKHRRAQYLARIARVCRDVGVVRADYEKVDVTKLREITTLNPKEKFFNQEEKKLEPMVDHIVRLIAEAPEMTTEEVDQEVARLKGMTGENAMVLRNYKVTLSAWENTISRCYESVRRRLGSKGRDGTGAAIEYPDGAVIEALCAEYNADPRNFMEETDCSQDQVEVDIEDNQPNTRVSIPSE